MSRAANGNSRKPYERPRPRGNDDMWVHDKAPGVPSSVINSAHGLGAANRASVNTKLIVSNLHYEVTAKDLIAVFGQIGTLVREPLIKYDRSGRSTGVAFISYETPVEATRAKKQFDGILAKGQPMSVAFDTGPPTGPRRAGARGRAVSAPTSLMERIEKPALLDRLASDAPQQRQKQSAALITSSTNGYDGSMMNGLQSLQQWEVPFNHPTGGKLGLLNAIQNIGSLGAYPFSPYLSDGIGRRPTIFVGAAIMVAATAIQTASQSVGMFIGARFLIGFGLTFAANAAPMLVSEISYPPYRAPLTSLYNSLWYSGAIIAAWTTFGTEKMPSSWAWRLPSVLQGLPSILQVVLVWFAPESPRWLISKGREMQALKLLAYYHADGNEQDPLVQYEFEEIKAAIHFDQVVAANVGWISFFKKSGNRKRLRIIIALAFFSQWSGNGLVSYYLNKVFDGIGITDPTTQLLINGILQIWNLCIAVIASFLVERLGRRFLFLTSCIGMAVFFTLQTACAALFAVHGWPGAAHAVIAFIFLFYAAYDIAFTPLIVSYTVEILPFQVRAKGFTIFNFAVSLSLIFNQYVNPIALNALAWKYYIVYCCFILFELVYCYLFVIETKNKTLEETAALFDGEEALEQIEREAETAVNMHENPIKDVRDDAVEKGSRSSSSGYVPQHELGKV